VRALLALAIALAAGCGEDQPLFGPPTESVCPPSSTLTYENFGREFMEVYCTRCHHSELTGADRKGAPSFHDFDTIFGIRAVSDHIDETTASGPAATNDSMPPDGDRPTLAEREQLAEWIACEMPE
jgi:predicted small lipoprotein YifL